MPLLGEFVLEHNNTNEQLKNFKEMKSNYKNFV